VKKPLFAVFVPTIKIITIKEKIIKECKYIKNKLIGK
jgi:hypothetical protein